MKCENCDNCVEDYGGNPYCLIGSLELTDEDMKADNVDYCCIDFEPNEGE